MTHHEHHPGGDPGHTIDLNCDAGEMPVLIADGTEEALFRHVTSVNVACGGHAGDEATMEATLRSAGRRGCAVGAHPSYPDREQFGRRPMTLGANEVTGVVHEQIVRLAAVAARCGTSLAHVKPHGALYNQAAHDPVLARAVAAGVARHSRDLWLVGLAGSPCLEVYVAAGFRVLAEAFADRRYEPDGRLRARSLPESLLTLPEEAAAQARDIAVRRRVTAFGGALVSIEAATICIHGDTPGAVAIAAAVSAALRDAGLEIVAPSAAARTS